MSKLETNTKLQLSREEMRELGYQVIDIIVDHFDSLHNKPAMRKIHRSDLETLLHEPLMEQGEKIGTVLEQLQQNVFSHIQHIDHPRFMGGVPSPSNFVSVMGDTLAAGFNVFTGVWIASPGPVTIELVTIDWLRQLCGLPDTAGGLFVSGGSIANLLALATARHVKLNDRPQNAIAYCSDQTHPVIDRGLHILGFEADQLRRLPSDEHFRLSLSALRQAVAEDRANGRLPFCVVANAGTTNTGAIDPLPALADFCAEEGLWLHADGAYGASAVLSDQGRALLVGLECVDSLTIDPHKWLFQPFEIGCVLVRNSFQLKDTFSITAEYIKDVEQGEAEVNFKDYSLQLTRSFRALKLWFSLKIFGLKAFRSAVAKGFSAAELAEQILRATPNWEIVTPAQLGVVTFRYAPPDFSPTDLDILNRQIVDRMLVDGFAVVNTTVLKGKTVIRMCPNNPRLTEVDIHETIQRLSQFGAKLSR